MMFTCGPSLFNAPTVPSPGDPYWSYVVSLLHFDGSSCSTTITDVRGLSWSAIGSASLSTASPRIGTASLNVTSTTGSGAYYSSSALQIPIGDFTIEFFIYATSYGSGSQIFFDMRAVGANGYYPVLYLNTGSNMYYYLSGSNAISGTPFPLNTLTHIALCRASGVTRLFVAGTQTGNNYSGNTAVPSNGVCQYGGSRCFPTSAVGMICRIDEARITIGYARYTTNFTPPVGPFPNHS